MSKSVLVTYKTNPSTGQPFRPDFTTTDINIEDHERMFSEIIKEIRYEKGIEVKTASKSKDAIPSSGVEPDHKLILKEKDNLILTLQNAIAKMNDETDVLIKENKAYKQARSAKGKL